MNQKWAIEKKDRQQKIHHLEAANKILSATVKKKESVLATLAEKNAQMVASLKRKRDTEAKVIRLHEVVAKQRQDH